MSLFRSSLLATVAVLGLAFPAFADPAQPPASGKYWVYIGTYTSKEGSQGIYRSELDVKTGTLSEPQLAAELTNPTFLNISPNGKFLYAIGETADQGPKKDEGTITAYKIDAKSGELTKLNTMTAGGGGTCHVSINSTGKYAIIANYGGGSSAMYSLKDDGSLDQRTFFLQHSGVGADGKKLQPRGHCAMFNIEQGVEYAYVVDLGLDQVYTYKLDAVKGDLIPTRAPFAKLPAGSGPRHIAFNAKTGKAYVCGESNSTINTLKRDGQGGLAMEPSTFHDAVISTLPKDIPAEIRKVNSTAEIVVHPEGGHVLVSNRGHNSLAVFEVNADTTTAGPHIMGTGAQAIKIPRNFNIDPTGRWILIGNQDGGSIFVAEWSNGNAKITSQAVKVKNAVCLKFLPKP